tara:strand:- start:3298 stop:3555 length:258 start_codon:yes stop_codon:yes gene_type:complete
LKTLLDVVFPSLVPFDYLTMVPLYGVLQAQTMNQNHSFGPKILMGVLIFVIDGILLILNFRTALVEIKVGRLSYFTTSLWRKSDT